MRLGSSTGGSERRGTSPDRRRSSRLHPAESAGAATGIAGVLAGVSLHNTLATATAACGLVPSVVTFIVRNGGLRGVVEVFWRGG